MNLKRLAPFALLAPLALLAACGGGVKTVSLSGGNGAKIELSMDTIGGTKLSVGDDGLTVKLPMGTVKGYLITSGEADRLISRHYNDGTFAEMTINGGTGFGFDVEDGCAHVVPVDGATYLYLESDSSDCIFELESMMTISSMDEGSDADGSFSDNVSKFGSGETRPASDLADPFG